MIAVTAYIVRGLQLLLGSSKRAMTERAEELGNESDGIPLADTSRSRQDSEVTLSGTPPLPEAAAHGLITPPRAQDPSLIRGTGVPPESSMSTPQNPLQVPIQPPQAPLPLTRPQRWAFLLNSNFDRITYGALFLFVGLPIYYSTGYAMPAQITFNILAYFAAFALPAKWKQFLHPVLVSSAITVLGIWILGLMRGDSLRVVLGAYKTNSSYLSFWHGKRNLAAPGMQTVPNRSLIGKVLIKQAREISSQASSMRPSSHSPCQCTTIVSNLSDISSPSSSQTVVSIFSTT